MTTFRDDFRFDSFFFFKDQLENQLGILLSEDNSNSSSSKENFNSINKELEPYKSRITINSWEAASLIVNNHPDADWNNTIVQSFKNSILNAVKNGVLISTDRNYDVNNELCYAEVYTNDVGLWAKKHNYNWPLPLDEDNETNNQNNNEYEQRIKLLEEELNKQKIINYNLEATKSSEQVSINDNRDLTEEINQLKLDNQKLTEQLNEAKKEIEELKNNHSQNLNDQLKKESPKTINAQAKFIKALLHHYYGEGIANNPRPHIENKDGEIKRDFETQGLSKNLPTGVVVKKWVDSIELEIDS